MFAAGLVSDNRGHSMLHNEQEISFSGCLQEFEDTVPREMKKKKRKKKDKPPEKGIAGCLCFANIHSP